MILKIKKNDFDWVYVETTNFEISSTYDEPEIKEQSTVEDGLSYAEAKNIKCIIIERIPKDEEYIKPLLKTYVQTDNVIINCIGEFNGYILNNKGQTIERL